MIGRFALLGSLALLLMPSCRRLAAVGVLISTAGAIIVGVLFHYNYALAIWQGHDSAIRYLDESAFWGGYAAGSIGYVSAMIAYAAAARFLGRA